MRVVITDGGRAAAGYKSATGGDCVARSIAIVTGLPYAAVYNRLAMETGNQHRSKRTGKRGYTAHEGINTGRKWFKDYMRELGFVWTPTMAIGSGCTVHLRASELPPGRLIVSIRKHYTVVVDGVIHDTYDPARGGSRCVYGYWSKP